MASEDEVLTNIPHVADGDPAPDNPPFAWFRWTALFGMVGILLTMLVHRVVVDWCERAAPRQVHAWMLDQADQLRRGEIVCLVNPDPAFVEELLADKTCAANVRELYLGGDLSDKRLGRLRELPHLERIVFLFAFNQEALLKSLDGMATVRSLTFEHTWLSHDDVNHIGMLPNLKSLAFDQYHLTPADLAGLRRHPSLERLSIYRASTGRNMISLFQSMPRLRVLSLGVCDYDNDSSLKAFQYLLRIALPRCKCIVRDAKK